MCGRRAGLVVAGLALDHEVRGALAHNHDIRGVRALVGGHHVELPSAQLHMVGLCENDMCKIGVH